MKRAEYRKNAGTIVDEHTSSESDGAVGIIGAVLFVLFIVWVLTHHFEAEPWSRRAWYAIRSTGWLSAAGVAAVGTVSLAFISAMGGGLWYISIIGLWSVAHYQWWAIPLLVVALLASVLSSEAAEDPQASSTEPKQLSHPDVPSTTTRTTQQAAAAAHESTGLAAFAADAEQDP